MPRFHPPIDKGPHQAAFTITAFRLGVLPEALRRAISGCVLCWQTGSGMRTGLSLIHISEPTRPY